MAAGIGAKDRHRLRAGLIAGEADQLDHFHAKSVREIRECSPGQILRATLDSRDRNRMQVGLAGEGFDAQSATFANFADRGSYLGEGRLRHEGKPASRDRGYKAITYMLVSRIPLKGIGRAQGGRDEREDRGGIGRGDGRTRSLRAVQETWPIARCRIDAVDANLRPTSVPRPFHLP